MTDHRDQEPHEEPITVGPGKLSNQPATAAPAISRLAVSAQQVQRAGTVHAAKPGEHGYARSNVIVPAHLVQWTPGIAGPITRAG